jgi:Flp pilus assembly protein protease CpaA
MLYDLRQREIPTTLTLICLAGAGVVALLQHFCAPFVLTVVLILVSDIHSPAWQRILAGIACLLACILQPASIALSFFTFAIWSFWDLGLFGGADAKLLIAVRLVTDNPGVLIPIFLAGGIQGLVARLRKKTEIPFVVSIFSGTFLFFLTPFTHI